MLCLREGNELVWFGILGLHAFAIMADIKGGSFIKVYQKHAGRAKERLLQNFGKADKTTDEIFDEYVNNFSKQQNAVLKLQKEVKNYHHCLKAMQAASKALMETICDLYEPNWISYDQVQVKAQILDTQWEDFCSRLNDQVINPLADYLVQFPEVSNKISKRRRKLLDYDGCRHHIQNLEQNSKKREEAKIAKAKEQLEEARNLYELINSELHEQLPALYDSRVSFFISNLQCLFIAEAKFHTESSKLFTQLNDVLEQLASENQKGSYSTRKPSYEPDRAVLSDQNEETCESHLKSNGESTKKIPEKIEQVVKEDPVVPPDPSNDRVNDDNDNGVDDDGLDNKSEVQVSDQGEPINASATVHSQEVPNETLEVAAASTSELPPGVLYRVKATYKYVAEDSDELSFEAGEIINVVEFDDPEEQEEGWLMGYKDSDPKRGLFPANFTRPI